MTTAPIRSVPDLSYLHALAQTCAGEVAINPRDPRFGAIGDGQADDTAAVQLALDALCLAGDLNPNVGMYVPPGSYRVTNTIRYTGNGVGGGSKIFGGVVGRIGQGVGAAFVWAGPAGGTLFEITGANVLTVDRLAFEAGKALRGIWVRSGQGDHPPTGPSSGVFFSNCILNGTSGPGSSMFTIAEPGLEYQVSELRLLRCVLTGSVDGSTEAGWKTLNNGNAKNYFIEDCVFSAYKYAIDWLLSTNVMMVSGGGAGGITEAIFRIGPDAQVDIRSFGVENGSGSYFLAQGGQSTVVSIHGCYIINDVRSRKNVQFSIGGGRLFLRGNYIDGTDGSNSGSPGPSHIVVNNANMDVPNDGFGSVVSISNDWRFHDKSIVVLDSGGNTIVGNGPDGPSPSARVSIYSMADRGTNATTGMQSRNLREIHGDVPTFTRLVPPNNFTSPGVRTLYRGEPRCVSCAYEIDAESLTNTSHTQNFFLAQVPAYCSILKVLAEIVNPFVCAGTKVYFSVGTNSDAKKFLPTAEAGTRRVVGRYYSELGPSLSTQSIHGRDMSLYGPSNADFFLVAFYLSDEKAPLGQGPGKPSHVTSGCIRVTLTLEVEMV